MATNRRRKKTDIVILIKAGVFLVVIILAVFLMLAIMKLANGTTDESASSSAAATSVETSDGIESEVSVDNGSQKMEFKSISVENTQMYTGNLVLVNNEHEFKAGEDDEIVVVYGKKSGDYKVGDTDVKLRQNVIDAMNTMMKAYTQLYSKKDLTIVSAYRTYEQQEKVYNNRVSQVGEEKAAKEVARPGHSDNHTGLAISLKIVAGQSVSAFTPTGDYAWVAENAFRYGFVQRFKSDKEEVTGMAGIDGYYRFVGLPHSYIMNVGNLSLEEYLAYIKTFRYDGEMLVQEVDSKTYHIYYHPAENGTSVGAVTNVPVPSNAEYYEISGNNFDGYVITAILQ